MISLSQETLSNALNAVTRASQKNSTLPAFAAVQLDASADGTLNLSCFNGETAARATLYARCADDVSLCVNAQTLKAVAETMLGEVVLKVEPRSLVLENGANRTTLNLIEETIPAIGNEQAETIATLTGLALRSLSRVIAFASTDGTRAVLNTLQLRFGNGQVQALAADGFSSGVVEESLPDAPETVLSLPVNFAHLLAGLVDERDTVLVQKAGANRCLFRITHTDSAKDLTLASVTGPEGFPAGQVAQLLKGCRTSSVTHLQVPKNSLLQTVKMVTAMGTLNTLLKASNGVVKAASSETDTGQARNLMDGQASGEDAHVWLSAVFLKRVAEACKGVIQVGITDERSAVLFNEGGFTALLMPLFMDNVKDPFETDDEPVAIALPALEMVPA